MLPKNFKKNKIILQYIQHPAQPSCLSFTIDNTYTTAMYILWPVGLQQVVIKPETLHTL